MQKFGVILDLIKLFLFSTIRMGNVNRIPVWLSGALGIEECQLIIIVIVIKECGSRVDVGSDGFILLLIAFGIVLIIIDVRQLIIGKGRKFPFRILFLLILKLIGFKLIELLDHIPVLHLLREGISVRKGLQLLTAFRSVIGFGRFFSFTGVLFVQLGCLLVIILAVIFILNFHGKGFYFLLRQFLIDEIIIDNVGKLLHVTSFQAEGTEQRPVEFLGKLLISGSPDYLCKGNRERSIAALMKLFSSVREDNQSGVSLLRLSCKLFLYTLHLALKDLRPIQDVTPA